MRLVQSRIFTKQSAIRAVSSLWMSEAEQFVALHDVSLQLHSILRSGFPIEPVANVGFRSAPQQAPRKSSRTLLATQQSTK